MNARVTREQIQALDQAQAQYQIVQHMLYQRYAANQEYLHQLAQIKDELQRRYFFWRKRRQQILASFRSIRELGGIGAAGFAFGMFRESGEI